MNRMDYGRSVVTVRVLEKRLLTKNRLERMIEAGSPDDVLKQLGETEYSHNMADIKDSRSYEKILRRETERVFSLVREMSNDSEIVDILSIKYDYHNLKVLLKSKLSGKDFTDLLMDAGTVKASRLKQKFEIQNYEDLPEEFIEAINEVEKDFAENNDPQKIDLIVDKYYYKHLSKIASKIDVEIMRDYVSGLIDFQNIITLLRVKKQNRDLKVLESVIHEGGNIPKDKIVVSLNDTPEMIANKFRKEKIGTYLTAGIEAFENTGRLSELEKISDNYLMALNRESKYVVFGPEPLFTYLVAKEREINAIRMIMVGKINSLDSDRIKERLRDTYA